MSEWLHMRTTNDTNGNPRRLFVEIDKGDVVNVVDEGYEGEAPARRAGMPKGYYPPTFDITPKEYHALRQLRGGQR